MPNAIKMRRVTTVFGLTLLLALFVLVSFYAGQDALASQSADETATPEGTPTSETVTPTLIALHLPSLNHLNPPTPTPLPQPGWLAYVNRFRSLGGVAPLSENGLWSEGGVLHSRYMVKNGYVGHDESSGNPWYTVEGREAAKNGNVFVSSWQDAPDEVAVDFWMTAPFHAVAILDPQLYETGFGSYREAASLWKMGGTLDVRRGLGSVPENTAFPLLYPKPGSSSWLLKFGGNEFPDPLVGCGYTAPTGAPIIVQLGDGSLTPHVTSHQVAVDGIPVASCLISETTYAHPDGGTQSSGRIILSLRDGLIILPRNPLAPGQTVSVRVTADGNTVEWSFNVIAAPSPLVPPADMRVEIR